MEEPGILPDQKVKSQRPKLLTVLCILTFIGSGMNFFSNAMIAAFYDAFTEIAGTFAEKFNLPGMDIIMESPPVFFLASAILYAGSFAGAFLMWRLRKTGFHIYTIAQILLIIAPMYFLKMSKPSFFDILFSGIFVVLYSINLKTMH